jgi:hypothetical protein
MGDRPIARTVYTTESTRIRKLSQKIDLGVYRGPSGCESDVVLMGSRILRSGPERKRKSMSCDRAERS